MDNDKVIAIAKVLALVSLIAALSGHYYGGNALFFLSEDAQASIRTAAISLCVLSSFVYLLLTFKKDFSNIRDGKFLFSKDVYENLGSYGLTVESVENILEKGESKKSGSRTRYSWTDERGRKLLIYTDAKGCIVDIAV